MLGTVGLSRLSVYLVKSVLTAINYDPLCKISATAWRFLKKYTQFVITAESRRRGFFTNLVSIAKPTLCGRPSKINPTRRNGFLLRIYVGFRRASVNGAENGRLYPHYPWVPEPIKAEQYSARLICTQAEALGGGCCDYRYVGDKSPALEKYKKWSKYNLQNLPLNIRRKASAVKKDLQKQVLFSAKFFS